MSAALLSLLTYFVVLLSTGFGNPIRRSERGTLLYWYWKGFKLNKLLILAASCDISTLNVYVAHLLDASDLDNTFLSTEVNYVHII